MKSPIRTVFRGALGVLAASALSFGCADSETDPNDGFEPTPSADSDEGGEEFVAFDESSKADNLNLPDGPARVRYQTDNTLQSFRFRELGWPVCVTGTSSVYLFRDEVRTAETGWAALGGVGSQLQKSRPDFDSRTYGYAKLSGLLKAIDLFELKHEGQHVWIRLKE